MHEINFVHEKIVLFFTEMDYFYNCIEMNECMKIYNTLFTLKEYMKTIIKNEIYKK
jgi:hypothetical protein